MTRITLTLLLLLGGTVTGQVNSGRVLGDVRDPSGALVPSTALTIKNEATGAETTTSSGEKGQYSFTALAPGRYEVTARAQGFQLYAGAGIDLHLDQQLRLDIQLTIGGADSITVNEAASELQTETASLGKVITSEAIRELPLLSRNFQDLLLLVPGVAPGAGGNISNYAVNGQREFANSIVINGVEVTGNRNNDSNLRPSVDAVEEFKAITSGYQAEFGRSGSGVVAIQTRSGGNAFHGALFEFLRTNKTTARSFFAPRPSALKENSFGGTLAPGQDIFLRGLRGQTDARFVFVLGQHSAERCGSRFFALTRSVHRSANPDLRPAILRFELLCPAVSRQRHSTCPAESGGIAHATDFVSEAECSWHSERLV